MVNFRLHERLKAWVGLEQAFATALLRSLPWIPLKQLEGSLMAHPLGQRPAFLFILGPLTLLCLNLEFPSGMSASISAVEWPHKELVAN